MKNLFLIFAVSIVLMMAACGKNDTVVNASLSGTWHIASDSTYTSGIGPNGTPSSNKYIGTDADYFKFDNSTLSINEGSFRTATATYTLSKDTLKLKYSYLDEGGVQLTGANNSYVITRLDSRSMQLKSYVLSPGGVFGEDIVLSR